MIKNKLVGVALISLLVLIFGALTTIAVLMYNSLSEPRPAMAGGGASGGRYAVVSMAYANGEEVLTVLDSSKHTIVVYRCWNGINFYPVAGRKIDVDHEYVDRIKTNYFTNRDWRDKNFMPNIMRAKLDKSNQ